jgi:hypothetical protein
MRRLTLLLLAAFCVATLPNCSVKAEWRGGYSRPVMSFEYIEKYAPYSLLKKGQCFSRVLETACTGVPPRFEDLQTAARPLRSSPDDS